MKVCHVCKAECEDLAELCHICGADITEIATSEQENEVKDDMVQYVLLASMADVVSAEIFMDILKDNGISFSCNDIDEQGTMRVGFGGMLFSCDIYVKNDDLAKAQELYEEFLNSQNEAEEFFQEEFDKSE